MIPIFLILAIVNIVLCLLIATRLHATFTIQRVPAQRKFFLFYLVFALAWLSWSFVYFPDSDYLRTIFDTWGYLFLDIAAAQLVQVPLLIRKMETRARYASIFILLLGCVYGIGRWLSSGLLSVQKVYNFYMWTSPVDYWLDIIIGIPMLVSVVTVTFMFYKFSESASSDLARRRARQLVASKAVLLVATLLAFFFLPFTLVAYTLSAALVAFSLLSTIYALMLSDSQLVPNVYMYQSTTPVFKNQIDPELQKSIARDA